MGKPDQTSINLTVYLTLWVKFMLVLMKSIDCESFWGMEFQEKKHKKDYRKSV